VSVGASRQGPTGRKRTAPASPQWLVLQGSGLLEAVATTNYACYGRQGVPRYPVVQSKPASDDRATLCVEVLLRDPAGEVRLACLDLDLEAQVRNDHLVIWAGYDAGRHLQVAWVWDFYRILSHAVLRVALPADSGPPDSAWQGAVEALRAAGPDDTIECRVRSACGDIHQQHRVEHAAVVWKPEQSPS